MSREMKHSGIEWIGEIPKEWKILQVKNLCQISRGRVIPITDMDESYKYPVYSSQTKNNGVMGYINTYDYNGDALTWTTDGANAGTMFYRNGFFNCTNVCGILQLKPIEIKSDIKYLLYSLGFSAFHSRRLDINGFKIMSNEMAEIKFVFPSYSEQQKIANYLDKVCGEVDEMIALQEQMIEELKAYKQSVITEAVTKGLNPNVPMRNSGIDWIGEIPEHWDVIKIGRLFCLRDEKNYKPMEEVQLLSLYTGIGVFPHGEQEERGNKAVTVEGYKVVHKNDIVVNIILAWMGAIGVSDYDGVTSPAYDVYIPNFAKVIPHFFHYVFRTKGIAAECYKYGRGIMMMRWRTYSSEFKQISVPYPMIEEQQAIASYLDEKCSEIDSLIALKQQKIEELKEYKKSVIYEYVTGKKEIA